MKENFEQSPAPHDSSDAVPYLGQFCMWGKWDSEKNQQICSVRKDLGLESICPETAEIDSTGVVVRVDGNCGTYDRYVSPPVRAGASSAT